MSKYSFQKLLLIQTYKFVFIFVWYKLLNVFVSYRRGILYMYVLRNYSTDKYETMLKTVFTNCDQIFDQYEAYYSNTQKKIGCPSFIFLQKL